MLLAKKWKLQLLPQFLMIPFIYLGTMKENYMVDWYFAFSFILPYILYVSIERLINIKTKEEFSKISSGIYSGIISYFFLSIFIILHMHNHFFYHHFSTLIILPILLFIRQLFFVFQVLVDVQKKIKVNKLMKGAV